MAKHKSNPPKAAPATNSQGPETGTPAPAPANAQGQEAGAAVAARASANNKPATQAKAKQAKAKQAKAKLVAQVVVVLGPKRGRWRAGRAFGADPVSIPFEDLSEIEMEALASDPALTVTTVPAKRVIK